MLKSLAIQNYALIDSLTIDLDAGFSVITGETGAGKSIILGALSLILGQRAETRHVKQNETKCSIEGIFDISKYNLKSLFESKDWIFEGDECIIRREIWANGKSRAFINDSPVYLNDLKELGELLIDLHSQHQNLLLGNHFFQLNTLDLLADTKSERESFSRTFNEFQSAKKELETLTRQSLQNKQNEDYLQFQFNTLSDAKLRPDEQDLLETELATITHAEDIKATLFGIVSAFSEDERSVENLLKSASDSLRNISSVFPEAEELSKRVQTAYIELKDVREESSKYFEQIDFNPQRQQTVEERLSLLYELQQKYGVQSVVDLLEKQEDIERQLQNISSFDEEIKRRQQDVSEKEIDMLAKARLLSGKRAEATKSFENRLIEKLALLGMPHARFQCQIVEKAYPDSHGQDDVQFLFSANKNVAMQPISQIASGGEISRLMLCVKYLIAGATALPTVIFDEIDTGTSGEIAAKMGDIMSEMSQNMQVIVITHLPQIAASADTHYRVYKEEIKDMTAISMKKLSQASRTDEIARMLSGAEVTAQAVENAKVMLGLS